LQTENLGEDAALPALRHSAYVY